MLHGAVGLTHPDVSNERTAFIYKGWEVLGVFTAPPPPAGGNIPLYPLSLRLDGLQILYGCFEEENNLLPAMTMRPTTLPRLFRPVFNSNKQVVSNLFPQMSYEIQTNF